MDLSPDAIRTKQFLAEKTDKWGQSGPVAPPGRSLQAVPAR